MGKPRIAHFAPIQAAHASFCPSRISEKFDLAGMASSKLFPSLHNKVLIIKYVVDAKEDWMGIFIVSWIIKQGWQSAGIEPSGFACS